MAGCEFNRQLEIDKYIENKEEHGEQFARQYLKTNMAHYRAKENGQPVPEWDVRLAQDGLATGGGDDLLQLTEQPLTSHLSGQVSDEIKVRVPIEMETIRHANDLAKSGADVILLPEHVTENGILRVRFVTIYTKDTIDSNLYHGSQIDLGQSMAPEEAKIRMQQMTENFSLIRSMQSNVHRDAFAFGIEKVSHGDEKSLSNRLRDFSKRETVGQHVPVFADEKPIIQHRFHFREPNDSTIQATTLTTRASIVETSTTAIMAGKYFIERLPKLRQKKFEKLENEASRKKYKQETKPQRKTDTIISTIQKRHTEMKIAKNTLAIIHETGVGIGAISLLISVLTKELPAPVRAVEKSMRRHKKKEVRRKNHEVRKRKLDASSDAKKGQPSNKEHKGRQKHRKAYKEVLKNDSKHISKERKGLRKRKRKIGVGEKTGKKIAVVDRLTIFTLKKEKQLRQRRLRQEAKKEKKLWRLWRAVEKSVRRHKKREIRIKNKELRGIAKREVKKDSVKVQPLRSERVEPLKERMQSIQRKKREAVVAIRFAWALWMLFHEDAKRRGYHIHNDDNIVPKKERAKVIDHSPTLPLLLSIILYLAMIREQGQTQVAPSTNQSFGMLTPKGGIIYQFQLKLDEAAII